MGQRDKDPLDDRLETLGAMIMTLSEVLARFRTEAQGKTTAYGAAFEILVKNILMHSALYRGRVVKVWRWAELGWGQDVGIDLVAESEFGELIGIQAKCYEEGHYVSKPDIDTFLATLGKAVAYKGETRYFDRGMVFASTDHWSAHAEETLSGQKIPCQFVTLSQMASWNVDWAVLAGYRNQTTCSATEKPLRDYQSEALLNAATYYRSHDRGKLIMACGTGKTLTSLRLIEQETQGTGLVLFLVPSIALLNQTLVAWSEDAKDSLHAICVCSDNKASRQAKKSDDQPEENPNALALPPTTNADEIVRRLRYFRETHPNELTIVFSTYQSIAIVEEAQRRLGREAYAFDFAVCDEAHRTTGTIAKETQQPAFTFIHSDEHVLVRKRLYMTATPRLYSASSKAKAAEQSIELCSMDDARLYGDEIFHIGFSKAVEKDCLSDYKVIVLTIPEKGFEGYDLYDSLTTEERNALESKGDDGRTVAVKLMGCVNALAKKLTASSLLDESDRVPARRAVAFCQTIAASKAITALFGKFAADARYNANLRAEAQHVDGSMSALTRNNALSWLKANGGEGVCRILTNVRCLSEGVDVPSLDAALFLSKRNSQIDVVQSVGRVMRKAPGKRYGYILIPVVIPADKDPGAELNNSDTFGVVWSVLNALRAHDDRFEAEINKLKFKDTQNSDYARILIDNGQGGVGSDADSGGNTPSAIQDDFDLHFPAAMEKYRGLLYGRLVEKCGDRRYFERWAADVADIATRHIESLKTLCETDNKARDAFNRYYEFLKTAVYTQVSEDDARLMLAQQRITRPIFDALFGNSDFTAHNPVSQALDHATDLLARLETEDDRKKLSGFYDSVRRRVEGITSADGKQDIIRTLYDTFFATAFKKTAEKLGIVFTPVEVVDFILRSADGALRTYFSSALSDKNVHILDPFTGTGTFIARLLQKDLGLIRQDDLYRKYTQELHANEIVLLSYYIAAINIENIFHDRQGQKEKYSAFPGIVLGDTFRMCEVAEKDTLDDGAFTENSHRLLAENKAPISVMIGNPPYSIGQKSANDNAQNENYPWLNHRIEETYVAQSSAANNKSLYDAYIEAFRWSSDRLDPEHGGIVCYVSNGGWLDSNAGAGFRKCLQAEFDHIYVYNLRGNQLTQGELSRKEGGKIFASGCRCPITILLLVRLPVAQHIGNAIVHYHDIGDYKTREEKLHTLDIEVSFFNPTWEGVLLTPNAHGDWINQRNDAFSSYIPLEAAKKFDEKSKSFFVVHALGVATNRDAWVYSFSKDTLLTQMNKSVTCFNHTISQPRTLNPIEISWSTNLQKAHEAGKTQSVDEAKIRLASYRPFSKQWQYFDGLWNERRGISPKLFPTGDAANRVICVSGGALLITDCTPDLHFVGDAQCFPLYWYEERDSDLFGKKTLVRHDGVSDFILKEAKRRYTTHITKEDLFYYVYGFLHEPNYRTTFAADLKKMLPRLPLVESFADFRLISDIGRKLAELHLHYETCAPYALREVGTFSDTHIVKMTFPGKDKTKVRVNDTLTLEDIPLEAHDYVVNGRSPVEWVLDRYQLKTDKNSGIVNDPNLWAPDNPRYIPDLIKRLVTLSLRTNDLVAKLPRIPLG